MSKKEPKTIEAEVEVVSSRKSNRPKPAKPATKASNQQASNPFAGMGGAGGMPDISAMFGKNGMPDLSKIPGLSLRQRLTFKIVGLISNPKLRFLKSKWSIPIWGIIAVLALTGILAAGFVFLIFKLLKTVLTPYINIFSKKEKTRDT
jgi:hypothetical protein